MVADNTTFFLAFSALFGGIALYLWRIEAQVRRLQDRLHRIESYSVQDEDRPPRP